MDWRLILLLIVALIAAFAVVYFLAAAHILSDMSDKGDIP